MRQLTISAIISIWPSLAFADVSGVYAAYDESEAEIIHIVESSDGTLRGQIEFFEISSRNELKTSSRNLTGAARKNAVAITLDAPILNWFSSTTMTGAVSSGTLKLSFAGGSGTYVKIDLAEREAIMRRVDATATRKKHLAAVDAANRHYASIQENLAELSGRASGDSAWFQRMKAEYQKLFSEAEALGQQRQAYRATEYDEAKLVQVENRQYAVKEQIWGMDSAVRSRSSSLRNLRMEFENSSKKLLELCGENGLRDAEIACSGRSKIETEFQTVISAVRNSFDELAVYRNTKGI